MSLKVEALTKIFGHQKAVDQISFEIEPGNVVGFLGPNGAGKSTTMKMISGFIPPTSGTAWVCGYDVRENPLKVKQILGYLPEKNPLYYDMYVREFLEFTAGVYQLGKNAKKQVDKMIALTGLQKEIKKKIGMLSKGYKQRVGLAQALIHEPKVLLLDEPTNGLDPNQIVAIRDLILQVSDKTTVLLSTHIMQEVQAMCSRVIIINNGKLVADDHIESLQKNVASESALIVEWEQHIEQEILSALKNIAKAEKISGQKWRFETKDMDQLRKEIMSFSLSHHLDIVSLQKEKSSLEQTFRTLTKDKEKNNVHQDKL